MSDHVSKEGTLTVSPDNLGVTVGLPSDPFWVSDDFELDRLLHAARDVDPDTSVERRAVAPPQSRPAEWDVRYREPEPEPRPRSRIRLSRPVTATLTADDVQGQVRAFVRDQNAKFDVLHVACGFNPAPDERIESAILSVNLSGTDSALLQDASAGENRPDPIAWSLDPLIRSGGGGDETTTARIGADLKLVQVGIDRARASHDVVSIKASGELTSTPSWSIQRTRVYELDRDERFVIVVRRERQAELFARLALHTDVSHRYRLFRRRRYERVIEEFIPLHPLLKQ